MKRQPVAFILTALAAGTLCTSALAEEPPRRSLATAAALFPFDAYAKHREAIGLSEDQVRDLGRLTEGMGEAMRKLEGERRERTEALQDALAQRPVGLEKAMERFHAVLQVEDEMKAIQFRSGVAAQNLLTPEQAEKVRAIAAKTQGSREAMSGAGAELRERLEQIKVQLRKRNGGELSKEAVGMLERIEQTAQKGNMGEVKNQMEALLAQLDKKGEAPRKFTKEPAENTPPSAAEIQQQIARTEKELAEASDAQKRERLEQQLVKLHKTLEYLAANPDASRREKVALKGDNESKEKGKQPDRPEKPTFKGEGEPKEKGKQPDAPEKVGVKGDGEKDKGKFDKNAENTKRPDPELRKRVEGALADFQEAKAAGNREGMEKITKSIESLLRDSARDAGGTKDGARREAVQKDGERKEGAQKDGTRREGTQKDGERKEGATKDGTRRETPADKP